MNQHQNFLITDQYFSKVVLYGFKKQLLNILQQLAILIVQQFLILLLNLMNDNNNSNNQFGHLLMYALVLYIQSFDFFLFFFSNQIKISVMVLLLIKIQHIHDNHPQMFHILIHQLLIVHQKMVY